MKHAIGYVVCKIGQDSPATRTVYKTAQRARRAMDRLDNAYGGYAYCIMGWNVDHMVSYMDILRMEVK